MTPQLGGGLDFPVLLAMMLVALLLRSALGPPRVEFWVSGRPPGIRRTRPGIVLGLVLGLGGLLLLLTALLPR